MMEVIRLKQSIILSKIPTGIIKKIATVVSGGGRF